MREGVVDWQHDKQPQMVFKPEMLYSVVGI
jgi:hypothetical protein